MKRCLIFLISALFVLIPAGSAWAQAQTVTGEVISIACYLQNKRNVGKAGHVCAIAEVKWEGNPAGILTSDGKVYQLAGPLVADNNAKIVPYLGQTVTVTGDVTKKEGALILTAGADSLKAAGSASQ